MGKICARAFIAVSYHARNRLATKGLDRRRGSGDDIAGGESGQ